MSSRERHQLQAWKEKKKDSLCWLALRQTGHYPGKLECGDGEWSHGAQEATGVLLIRSATFPVIRKAACTQALKVNNHITRTHIQNRNALWSYQTTEELTGWREWSHEECSWHLAPATSKCKFRLLSTSSPASMRWKMFYFYNPLLSKIKTWYKNYNGCVWYAAPTTTEHLNVLYAFQKVCEKIPFHLPNFKNSFQS